MVQNRNTTAFAKKIRLTRKEMGITQEKISKKIGISRATYIRVEQGVVMLRFDKMNRLLGLLKLEHKGKS